MLFVNRVESFWALLKRGHMGTFHKISEKNLHRYINEFSTRHNMRNMNYLESSARTIKIMTDKRLTYKELTA